MCRAWSHIHTYTRGGVVRRLTDVLCTSQVMAVPRGRTVSLAWAGSAALGAGSGSGSGSASGSGAGGGSDSGGWMIR